MSGKLTAIAGCCLTFAYLLQAQVPPIYLPPGIQQERPIHNVRPVYPELAKQAHIQGTVRLAALIDENGIVERLRLISGHPFLVKATFDAVKQWQYRPATYHGEPVAVFTIIDVNFSLGIGEPPPSDRPDAVRILVVRMKGLEPSHPCGYMDLNHARLPIPPHPHKPGATPFFQTAKLESNCGKTTLRPRPCCARCRPPNAWPLPDRNSSDPAS